MMAYISGYCNVAARVCLNVKRLVAALTSASAGGSSLTFYWPCVGGNERSAGMLSMCGGMALRGGSQLKAWRRMRQRRGLALRNGVNRRGDLTQRLWRIAVAAALPGSQASMLMALNLYVQAMRQLKRLAKSAKLVACLLSITCGERQWHAAWRRENISSEAT